MKKFLIFLGGMAVGGGGAFFAANAMLKQKYEQISEEEITSVKDSFRKELEKRIENTAAERKDAKELYDNAMEAMKSYSGEASETKTEKKPAEGMDKPAPYIISAMDYADPTKPYQSLPWKYFSDGAVVKEDNKPVMNLEELDRLIGRENIAQVGDDEDVLYVRNERIGCDFEITMVGRTWADELKEKPHLRA